VNLGSDTKLKHPDPMNMGTLQWRTYAGRQYPHVRTLSLSTENKHNIHNNSSIN